jgi:hypothetical protein
MEDTKKEITIDELIKIYGEDSVYRSIKMEYGSSFYSDYLKLLPSEIKINPEVNYPKLRHLGFLALYQVKT